MQTHGRPATEQSIISASSGVTIDDIFDMLTGELVLSSVHGQITTDSTEQDLFRMNAPIGIGRCVTLYVNLDNMVGGDTTVFKVYYHIYPAAGLEQVDYQSYTGVDGGLANGNTLIAIDLGPFRFGMDVTIESTALGDQTEKEYDWQIFLEV